MTDALRALIADGSLGVLATLKRDGRSQMSMVSYAYDPERDLIRVSITADRAKTKNIRRDPRVTMLVTGPNRWSYAVAEGDAQLGPTAQDPQDDSVNELVDIYRSIGGEHPDWDEYRAAMVKDRRVPLSIHVGRVYGMVS